MFRSWRNSAGTKIRIRTKSCNYLRRIISWRCFSHMSWRIMLYSFCLFSANNGELDVPWQYYHANFHPSVESVWYIFWRLYTGGVKAILLHRVTK